MSTFLFIYDFALFFLCKQRHWMSRRDCTYSICILNFVFCSICIEMWKSIMSSISWRKFSVSKHLLIHALYTFMFHDAPNQTPKIKIYFVSHCQCVLIHLLVNKFDLLSCIVNIVLSTFLNYIRKNNNTICLYIPVYIFLHDGSVVPEMWSCCH